MSGSNTKSVITIAGKRRYSCCYRARVHSAHHVGADTDRHPRCREEPNLFGRILLDNADWLITAGLLGGIKITLKNRGLTRRANRGERRYLMEILESLRAVGVPIERGSEPIEVVLDDFASAVFCWRCQVVCVLYNCSARRESEELHPLRSILHSEFWAVPGVTFIRHRKTAHDI